MNLYRSTAHRSDDGEDLAPEDVIVVCLESIVSVFHAEYAVFGVICTDFEFP